jgi:hypothetical protein
LGKEDEVVEAIKEHLEQNPPEVGAYLVRGANLYCEFGSHVRKLNLPKDHAVHITKQPMIHELDCMPTELFNISSFGVCTSPGSGDIKPSPPTVTLKNVAYDQEGNVVDTGEDMGTVVGLQCTPMIVGTWQNTYETTRIVDNGDKDPTDKLKDDDSPDKGYEAVTTNSFLVCKCAGIISPISSGQVIE